MAQTSADKWNVRYREEGVYWQASEPAALLQTFADRLPAAGLALDAAGGVGVNGLFLAERGLHVIVLDIAEVGLRLAQERARERGVWLETAVYDLSSPWLPPNTFDVILNFRFLERAAFPVYKRALKPGGWLLFETFVQTVAQSDTPSYFLQPGELAAAFPEFDILHTAEKTRRSQRSGNLKIVAQLVARKRNA